MCDCRLVTHWALCYTYVCHLPDINGWRKFDPFGSISWGSFGETSPWGRHFAQPIDLKR